VANMETVSLPTVLQDRKFFREQRIKSLLHRWMRGLVVGKNDSEKLRSMRKESVKLLKLFSKN